MEDFEREQEREMNISSNICTAKPNQFLDRMAGDKTE